MRLLPIVYCHSVMFKCLANTAAVLYLLFYKPILTFGNILYRLGYVRAHTNQHHTFLQTNIDIWQHTLPFKDMQSTTLINTIYFQTSYARYRPLFVHIHIAVEVLEECFFFHQSPSLHTTSGLFDIIPICYFDLLLFDEFCWRRKIQLAVF